MVLSKSRHPQHSRAYSKLLIYQLPSLFIQCLKIAPNIKYQVSPHQKLAVFWPFWALNPCQLHHIGIRSGQMTYHFKSPHQFGNSGTNIAEVTMQWEMSALDFFNAAVSVSHWMESFLNRLCKAKICSLSRVVLYRGEVKT